MLRLALLGLVLLGTWSSGKLSWQQYLSGEACPILSIIPACYLAFTGYLMMLLAIILRTWNSLFYGIFWGGLTIAGGLALLGSLMELGSGKICPRAYGWLPMCYVSLGFSVLVGVLNVIVIRRQAVTPSTKSEQGGGD